MGRLILSTLTLVALLTLVSPSPAAAFPETSPTPPALSLTPAEKSWVASHRTVRVRISQSYPPFEFFASNRYQGMCVDYLTAIGRRLGIEFKPVTGLKWPEALDRLKGRSGVDLVLVMTHTPEREASVEFTREYLSFPQVIFTRKDGRFIAGLDDLSGGVVAVERGVVMKEWLLRDYPAIRLLETGSPEESFMAVANGKADAYVQNLGLGSYYIDKKGLTSLKVAAPAPYETDRLSMGVRKDWPELARLIDKALDAMTEEEQQEIRHRWLSLRYEYGLRPVDIFKWSGGVALLALCWILLLRRMVKNRTAAIEKEIINRTQLEIAYKDQLNFLQTLIDTIPSPIFYKDRNGRYLGSNRAFGEFVGRSREELIGKTVYDVAPPDRVGEYVAMDEALFAAPGVQTYESTVIYADGSRHEVIFNKATFNDADGRIGGLVGIILDVTDRKRTETALAEREAFLANILDCIQDGICIFDTELKIVRANPVIARRFADSAPLVGKRCHEAFHGNEEPCDCCPALVALRSGAPSVKTISRQENGAKIWLEIHTFPLYDSDRTHLTGVIEYTRDITERKRMEDELRASEERYRTVFETTGSAMLIIEADTTISLANRQFAKLCDYPMEEIAGKMSWVDVVATADRERMLGYHRSRRIDPAGAPAAYEFQLVTRTGTVRDIATSVNMIPGTARSVQSYLDITGLKQTERLLAGEKETLELIVADTPLADVLARLCLNIEQQSFGALCSVLLLGSDNRLRHAAGPSLPEEYNRAIDGTRIGMDIGSCGTAAFTRTDVIASDIATDPRWTKYRRLPLSFGLRACWSRPILSTGGEVLGTFAIYYTQVRSPDSHDLYLIERGTQLASIVIERHRSAEALRQMQIHQRAILDTIPDMVWLKDRESRYITVNRAFAAGGNLSPEEVAGKTDLDLFPQDLAGKYREEDRLVMESGENFHTEEQFAWQGKIRRWLETFKMPVRDEQGTIIGTTGIARDIHERKLAIDALRESEERFHNIFDQNEDAIILFRLDTFALVDANPAARALFGFSRADLHTLAPHSLIDHGDFQELIDEISMDGETTTFQLDRATGIRRDGTTLSIVIRASILHLRDEYVVHCSIRDVSEKLRLEQEIKTSHAKLIQANKMTSLGMLSSSVAHEINNPNNCISVNAAMLADIWSDAEPILRQHTNENGDFLLRGLPFSRMDSMVPRLIHGITEGSRRITAIIENMKQFVREGTGGQKSPVDINKLVENATAILWHHIHMHTERFSTSLQDNLPPAYGNGQQLEQVIINLLMNALQALPDRRRGVAIATGYDRQGEKVVVTVQDQGVGMEPAIIARLSEPFFTTRMESGGTGLGIYISSSIVKEHDGTIEFSSEPGRGTTVTVTLPMEASMLSCKQP